MIKGAIIGLGKWSNNYIRNLNDLSRYCDVDIKYLCSRNKQSFSNLKETLVLKDSLWVSDYKDIENVNFVIVATPPEVHYEICKHFLENKISVLCEKPFTLNSKDAAYLNQLAKEKGVSLVIDYIHLWNNFYQKVKAGRPASEIQNINFIVNAPNEGREHHSVLYDWMSHDLAMLVHLFGEMPRNIRCIHNDTDILKSRIFALDCNIGDSTSSIWLNANANRRSRSIIVTYKDGATLQTVDTFEFNALREVLVDFLNAVGNNLAVSNGPLAHEVGLLLEDIQNYDQNRH